MTLCTAPYFLPQGYRPQPRGCSHDSQREGEPYWSPWRLAENGRFQYHVYAYAARLARRHALRSLLDVGCGPGVKLGRFFGQRSTCMTGITSITGIDQPATRPLLAQHCPHVSFIAADLDNESDVTTQLAVRAQHKSNSHHAAPFDLVICADVLEHLTNPCGVMRAIRNITTISSLILLSTPDRDRERGRSCRHSPKPEHVREWASVEFTAYARSHGLAVLRHFFVPKADQPRADGRAAERAFRAGKAPLSPWACQMLLCVHAHSPGGTPS